MAVLRPRDVFNRIRLAISTSQSREDALRANAQRLRQRAARLDNRARLKLERADELEKKGK